MLLESGILVTVILHIYRIIEDSIPIMATGLEQWITIRIQYQESAENLRNEIR